MGLAVVGHVLFQMYEGFRQHLINKHKFYVDQGHKRLLSQFSDIEGEADTFVEKWLEDHKKYFNPEYQDPSDMYENAQEEAVEFYGLLSDMHDSTRLSIITGMFHEWEKQLRDWLMSQIQHWHRGEALKSRLWGANFDKIMELFELLGWQVKSMPFYDSLDTCRLVANVYKHGEGSSFNRLKTKHKEFFDLGLGDGWSDDADFLFIDYSHLNVSTDHLDEFSNAIVAFWQGVPEELPTGDNPEIPDWFAKAMEKDRSSASAN